YLSPHEVHPLENEYSRKGFLIFNYGEFVFACQYWFNVLDKIRLLLYNINIKEGDFVTALGRCILAPTLGGHWYTSLCTVLLP
ncbi:MAG: hypothetical protein NC228_10185, partial [[Eubacterium] siraeum]|nr:hypothetical protein [[Eubacterium] siraeum]